MNAAELGKGYAQSIINKLKKDPPERLLNEEGKQWLRRLCTDGLSQDIYHPLCDYLVEAFPGDENKQTELFAAMEHDLDFQEACNDELVMEYDYIVDMAARFYA